MLYHASQSLVCSLSLNVCVSIYAHLHGVKKPIIIIIIIISQLQRTGFSHTPRVPHIFQAYVRRLHVQLF